jgi:hypothetical protein
MAPTKKIKEAIKEQLTKEDLLKLLSEKPQKQVRKKRDLDEEAKVKMNEKMAQMRVMALEKRQALKKEKDETPKESKQDFLNPVRKESKQDFLNPVRKESNIDLFEKKYNSQFEKMNDTLSKLDLHLNEMKDLKKSKREMILNFGKQAMMQDLENPARKLRQQDLEKQDLENPARKVESQPVVIQPELKKGSREVEVVKSIIKPSIINPSLVVPKIIYKNVNNANKYY